MSVTFQLLIVSLNFGHKVEVQLGNNLKIKILLLQFVTWKGYQPNET